MKSLSFLAWSWNLFPTVWPNVYGGLSKNVILGIFQIKQTSGQLSQWAVFIQEKIECTLRQ